MHRPPFRVGLQLIQDFIILGLKGNVKELIQNSTAKALDKTMFLLLFKPTIITKIHITEIEDLLGCDQTRVIAFMLESVTQPVAPPTVYS